MTDPSGRVTTFSYTAKGMDLLQARNITGSNNDVLATYTYNSQHKPLTATDASNQTVTFVYNSWGQVTSITNPRSEVTTLTYDEQGYLSQFLGALPGSSITFPYEPYGRLASLTPAG